MVENKQRIICILGPTASGKTDLATTLLSYVPAELISVDSAMVYRGMNIGTAKPTPEELKVAPHRLIDLCEPTQVYSAGQFCDDALSHIQEILTDNKVPILVGGTMLYFNKLLHGMAELPTADAATRELLSKKAENIGWAAMHAELDKIDPTAATKIKPTDPQRIQRALEVFEITGRPISEFHQEHHQSYLADYDVVNIALVPEDRAWLHARIEQRFDQMLAAGFLDEVKILYDNPRVTADLPAMRMVGYRQAWAYWAGEINLDQMRDQAVAATRQLAKRQLTWLRRWEGLHRFDPQDPNLCAKVRALL